MTIRGIKDGTEMTVGNAFVLAICASALPLLLLPTLPLIAAGRVFGDGGGGC